MLSFIRWRRKNTDKNGLASLITGLGDLMIWATAGNSFAYQKVTVEKTDTLQLVLTNNSRFTDEVSLTFVPPVPRQPKIPDAKGKTTNDMRLKQEDSIRNAYVATFIDSIGSLTISHQANLNTDSVWNILKKSRGNWKDISRFIIDGSRVSKTNMYQVLNNISEKDLRDTPHDILSDHLNNSYFKGTIPKEFFLAVYFKPTHRWRNTQLLQKVL